MTPGSAAPTPAAALDVLVETVCDLLDVDYAGVHLVDHDVHRVRASSDAVPHPPMPRSDSPCGVLLTRHVPPAVGSAPALEIIEVPDTAADPTLPYGAGTEVAPVRFYAAAPLLDERDRPHAASARDRGVVVGRAVCSRRRRVRIAGTTPAGPWASGERRTVTDDDGLLGTVVHDASGTDLGTVTALRVDPDGRRARWLDLALPDGGRATVPVQAASVDGTGRVVLPFSAEDLRTAPATDGTVVSAELARALLRHYGFPPDAR